MSRPRLFLVVEDAGCSWVVVPVGVTVSAWPAPPEATAASAPLAPRCADLGLAPRACRACVWEGEPVTGEMGEGSEQRTAPDQVKARLAPRAPLCRGLASADCVLLFAYSPADGAARRGVCGGGGVRGLAAG